MNVRNNEIFLYKERAFPESRDPRKNPLERAIYVWKFACTGKKIMKDSSNELGRFVNKSKPKLIQDIINFYNLREGSEIILLSNKYYKGDFFTEGSHTHTWIHQERGLDKDVLELFAESFRNKGINVWTREMALSVRYLFR